MSLAPRVLGAVALVLGGLAAVAGESHRSAAEPADLRRLAVDIANRRGEVSAMQLAGWIRSRTPGLRILDLRGAEEFSARHIPTAELRAVTDLPDSPPDASPLVLYSDGEAAAQAWLLLRARGHQQVFFLPRGLTAWEQDVLHPVLDDQRLRPEVFNRLADLSRYFGGAPTVGTGPQAVTSEAPAPPAPLPLRARSGGC